jgi:hypothetical protein
MKQVSRPNTRIYRGIRPDDDILPLRRCKVMEILKKNIREDLTRFSLNLDLDWKTSIEISRSPLQISCRVPDC